MLQRGHELRPPFGLEGPPVVDAVDIDRPNEIVLDARPTFLQARPCLHVDRGAGVLHSGSSGHVAPSQQRPREIDLRQHGVEQPGERVNVTLAVIQNFSRREAALPCVVTDRLLHFLFFGGPHGIQPEVGQGTKQARTCRCRQAVGAVAELGEEVEDALRHRPAERAITPQLRGCVVRDEEHVRPRRVGRRWPRIDPAIAGSGARCAAREPRDTAGAGARRG